MSGRFFASYAWRSLRRGGQRSVLAAVCVAFGVLSLVALQQLSAMIADAMLVSPRHVQGGDIVVETDGIMEPATVDSLVARGFEHVSPRAIDRAMWMKTASSGRATLVTTVLAVDPARFPLYGEVTLHEPAGASLGDALGVPGGAVLTRDLAERFAIAVGDTVSLFGSPRTPPFALVVTGIASATPSRRGLAVFVGLDTARERADAGVTAIALRHHSPDAAVERLKADGWNARLVPERADTQEAELFGFMLQAAGILGLLLGGIGVANTMQVLLARRRLEIATLKTLGYQQRHLLFMFGIEAAMLGVIGGVAGVVLGVALARLLMDLLSASMPYILDFRVRSDVVVGGIVVGVVTALVFGMAAIVRASYVRPSVLLRDTPIRARGRHRVATAALYSVLFITFGGLSGLVLGSIAKGFGVVAAGVVGLLVVGLVLGAVLLIVVRVPISGLLGMARRNLRHQPQRSIYGLVALFAGVVAIGFATVSIGNASDQMRMRSVDLSGINVRVYATASDEAELRRAAKAAGVTSAFTDHSMTATVRNSEGIELRGVATVFGRTDAEMHWNLTLVDSADVPTSRAVYVHERVAARHDTAPGDTLTLHGRADSATVMVAGVYESGGGMLNIGAPPLGLVVSLEVARRVGGDSMPILLALAADPARVGEVSEAVGRAVPESVVIGKDALSDAINRLFRGLFTFAVAIAGLALVAGAVLIANSVGLSMLERRRELGVLKAIGYSSAQVLRTVLLENALLGFIGGALGVSGVHLTVGVVNAGFPEAGLSLGGVATIALVLVAIAFAVISALLVAWRPTHVRPLEVLRGE